MRRLSLGTQSYRRLVEQDLIYVDKTEIIYKLITEGFHYFLSRPRRFGKSLTISTLKEIFLGNRELFKGTYIYNSDYRWTKYPVIHFDFSCFDAAKDPGDLDIFLNEIVDSCAEAHGIILKKQLTNSRFSELIEKLSEKGRVVILIDEYDSPLISNIKETEKALVIQETLRGFFKVIKSLNEFVHFVFLTGVTKFSQVSVFSALNNLTDITMQERYASLCGYTEKEIDENFKDYILLRCREAGCTFQELFRELRFWYNGFQFSESDSRVYNPWSVLSYLNTGKFKNYWFQTGTPTFLIDLIKKENFSVADSAQFKVSGSGFTTFDIENLDIKSLLFQTGYLTIKKYESKRNRYLLDFPNKEVKQSFLESLLRSASGKDAGSLLDTLTDALESNDLDEFFESIDILLSKVDYDLHLKDEKYWQSLFYMILTLLGYNIFAEFKTSKGRIDAVLETDTHIYIFEFKISGTEEAALEQIKEREYFSRFMDKQKALVLVGSRFVIEEKHLKSRYVSEVI